MNKRHQLIIQLNLLIWFCGAVLAQTKPAFLKPFAYSKRLDGYYLVYQNHYFGLLDSLGNQLAPCRYDDIDRFYDGMAEVSLKGRHGYINKQGKLIVPLRYARANPFQNGEGLVVTPEGDVGYLNTKGQPVAPFSQFGRPYFRGRYAKGWVLQPYIGKQNRESIGEFYIAAEGYTEYVPQQMASTKLLRKTGLSLIFSGDRQFRRYGFSDSAGHIIVPMIFEDASETEYAWKDWIRVKKKDHYGFFDRQSGKLVIPMQYEDSQPSAYNRIWVKQDGKWGCIDRTGNVVIPFHYSAVSAYAEDRAIVEQGNQYGYVDTTGRLVVAMAYDKASYYHQGKAKVYQGPSWLELDTQGNVVDSGLQADVFWDRVKYGIFVCSIFLFIFYVYRHKLTVLN